jgi:integrase
MSLGPREAKRGRLFDKPSRPRKGDPQSRWVVTPLSPEDLEEADELEDELPEVQGEATYARFLEILKMCRGDRRLALRHATGQMIRALSPGTVVTYLDHIKNFLARQQNPLKGEDFAQWRRLRLAASRRYARLKTEGAAVMTPAVGDTILREVYALDPSHADALYTMAESGLRPPQSKTPLNGRHMEIRTNEVAIREAVAKNVKSAKDARVIVFPRAEGAPVNQHHLRMPLGYLTRMKEAIVDDTPLFPAVNAQSINQLLRKIPCAEGYTSYSFRKFAAQRVYQETNGDIDKIRIFLGHKDVKTTQSFYCSLRTEIEGPGWLATLKEGDLEPEPSAEEEAMPQ